MLKNPHNIAPCIKFYGKPEEDQYFSNHAPWYWQSVTGSTMIGMVHASVPKHRDKNRRWPMRKFVLSDGTSFRFPEIIEKTS